MGKTSENTNKNAVDTSGTAIAKAKRDAGNKRTVVGVGNGREVYYKADGKLVLRGTSRGGGLNKKANALHKCKGKKGDSFKTCARSALGFTDGFGKKRARKKKE